MRAAVLDIYDGWAHPSVVMQYKQPSAPVPPSGLTRAQVARQLGTTVTTVHRMRLRGELHPKRDANGVYRYDPADVIRAAGARKRSTQYTPGQIASRAFQMFDHGGELKEIVIALEITPEEVFRLYRLWQCSLDDPPPVAVGSEARLLDEEPGAEEAFARAMAQAAELAELPARRPKR